MIRSELLQISFWWGNIKANTFVLRISETYERLARERDERRVQREARREIKRLEPKGPPKRNTRRVEQLNDDGDVIAVFESISEAVKTTGTNSKSIRDCCNGIQKHAGGFVWKYLDNDKTN